MKQLRNFSRNSWVRVGPNKLVLELTPKYGMLIIEGVHHTNNSEPSKSSKNISKHDDVCVQNLSASKCMSRHQYADKMIYHVSRRFKPLSNSKGKHAHFSKTVHLFNADLLSSAIRAADTYVNKHIPLQYTHFLRFAAWRHNPASDKQLDYLRKFVKVDGTGVLTVEDLASMTRGRAADLITKLLNGARGSMRKRSSVRVNK